MAGAKVPRDAAGTTDAAFTDELISAAPTFIAVGAWVLLAGGGWTRQLSAESRAPRYRSDTRTPSSGVIPSPLELLWAAALLALADLILGILWTVGAKVETYDAILVFAPSPFVSFAFALLFAIGVVVAVSMLRVRRLASSEFAELGELPRQFILVNALIVAACLILPISPRSMDDVDFFLGACVPVLVSVLGLGLVGGFRTKLAEAIAQLPVAPLPRSTTGRNRRSPGR